MTQDWPERLDEAVSRVATASIGFEPSGDVAVVLSGATDKLAATLESLWERVVRPSRARVFTVLSGGDRLSDTTRRALEALPFVGGLCFVLVPRRASRGSS